MTSDQDLEQLSFTVSGFISKEISEVYEAVADPEKLSSYFTTGGAKGRAETGEALTWDFHDFPGAFPVKVIEAQSPKKIVIQWGAEHTTSDNAMNTVTFDFTSVDNDTRTKVDITETSWQATTDGAKAAFGNCMGWTGMMAAMKAWLEYGINLREGFYK